MSEYTYGAVAAILQDEKYKFSSSEKKNIKRKTLVVKKKSEVQKSKLTENLVLNDIAKKNSVETTSSDHGQVSTGKQKNKKKVKAEAIELQKQENKKRKMKEILQITENAEQPLKKKKKVKAEVVELQTQENKKRMLKEILQIPENAEKPQKKKKKLKVGKKDITIEHESCHEISEQKCQTDSSDAFTVFVGNLPPTYDKRKVVKTFSKFGEIENARIRCTPAETKKAPLKVAARKKQYIEVANSVCAYIRFKTFNSVKSILRENGMVLEGHHIKIDSADPSSKAKEDKRKGIYLQNLPYDIEDDALWDFFGDCGKITSVRLIKSRAKGYLGTGVGYVNFEDAASVELALQLDGQLIKTRPVQVQRCRPPITQPHAVFHSKETKGRLNSKNAQMRVNKKNSAGFQQRNRFHSDTTGNFQGRIAEKIQKSKKVKKPSRDALHKKKIRNILGKKTS